MGYPNDPERAGIKIQVLFVVEWSAKPGCPVPEREREGRPGIPFLCVPEGGRQGPTPSSRDGLGHLGASVAR